ncbi:hypothetical protein DY000_02040723 [Brassica cretica]|uniref:Uncharacterized protein n=1 Tax=Brassica cretica TaxID=69181 RepID=A0ABQ7BKQ5_BRACR|nr:hypothetical protein DY000_02040723 [Brassica cretica]
MFSLSEVFHFLEGRSVPRIDPRAPLKRDSAPSVLLSWVPLKPKLILNPVSLERTRDFDMHWTPLSWRSNAGRVVLRALPSNPFVSEMRAESGLFPDSSSIGSRVRSSKVKDVVAPLECMDSSDSSLDLTAEVEDPKAIVARTVSPVAEGNWVKYNLPADVVIRVPGPDDRVSDFGVDEVPVYEGYFESGFRDRVPSLVAKISETLEISPGQLNPPAWRTLISLQNLGDLQGLVIGVAEVLCSYSVSPLSGTEWRYYLRPGARSLMLGRFTSCGLFFWEGDHRAGVEASYRAMLYSFSREMLGSKGDEALAEYKKAFGVMSTRKSAPKRAASVEDDEVQFLRSSKRLAVTATAPSSSKKKCKASGSSPSASYDWATVFTNLNTKVFSSTPVLLASEEDSSVAIQSLQGDLLLVASQLFHLGERMVGAASTKPEMDALASQLRKEMGVVLAKDKEIKAFRLKVRNQEAAGELAATENVSLRGQLKNREEELNDLKDTAEIFEAEKAMAVNGAKYKTVKITKAELLGLPTPSFEGVLQVPGDVEAEKTPEHAVDDPPAN